MDFRTYLTAGMLVLLLLVTSFAPPRAVAGAQPVPVTTPAPEVADSGTKSSAPRLHLEYELHWRFLRILRFTSTSTQQPGGAYEMKTEGETAGIVNTFFPWKARSESRGTSRKGRLVPAQYRSWSHFRDNTQEIEVQYGSEIPRTEVRGEILTEGKRDPVPAALQRNTLDPLTAIAELTRRGAGRGVCEGRWPIFDGLRRYDLLYDNLGPTEVPVSDNDPWQGPGTLCRVRFDVQAGQWRGEERPEEDPSQVLVWLQPLLPGMDPIPVRFRVESPKGALDVHLVKHPVLIREAQPVS